MEITEITEDMVMALFIGLLTLETMLVVVQMGAFVLALVVMLDIVEIQDVALHTQDSL